MSFLDPFLLIRFCPSSHCISVIFSQFFACLKIFDWMPDVSYSLLLRDVYFNISVNIVELCSWTQLYYLETLVYFWVLLLSFVKQYQNSIWSRANFVPVLRQLPPEYSSWCLMNFEIFYSVWWNWAITSTVGYPRMLFPITNVPMIN